MSRVNPIPSHTLVEKLNQFSPKQQKILFQNTSAIQLTEGCSLGCSDCGAGALARVRDYITPDEIKDVLHKGNKQFKNLSTLFFASEPFDYDFEGYSYIDIHKSAIEITGSTPFVATSIPKGKEKEILEVVLKKNYIKMKDLGLCSIINRISLMKTNYDRLENAYSELDDYKTDDQIRTTEFETGLNGAIEMRNLELAKKLRKNIYVIGEVGKEAFIVPFQGYYYAKFDGPVEFMDIINELKRKKKSMDENPFSYRYQGIEIYDFYSQNLPTGQIHTLKLGKKHIDDLSSQGIGCLHGVVLTPKGIYNLKVERPSKENPLGLKKIEITPDNFEVIPCTWVSDYASEKYFFNKELPKLEGRWIKDNVAKAKTRLMMLLPV